MGFRDPGKLAGLLTLLREHEGAVEADLARYYSIDYRDRWRGTLTLRQLFVRIQHLPPDSATGTVLRGGKPHWTLEAMLLDNLRMSLTGTKEKPAKPHPMRPRPQPHRRQTPERKRKLADARRRRHERQRRIDAGEIT